LQSAFLTALAKKPTAVLEAGSPQSLFGQSTIDAYKAANVPIILGSIDPVTLGNPIYARQPVRLQRKSSERCWPMVHCGLGRQR